MKTKILMIVLPTVAGIVAVIGVLFIINIVFNNGTVLTSPDNGFLSFYVPLTTVCAMIVQYLLTIPFWKRFKSQGRVFGMKLLLFTSLIIIIGGLIFGFVFWDRSFGVIGLIGVSITGIGAFVIYWTGNLLILNRLDKV